MRKIENGESCESGNNSNNEGVEINSTLVLIVDDEEAVRDGIAYSLSNKGYRTVIAINSSQALDAFHSSCPDLIVFDIDPGDNRGLKTLEDILKQSPNQPIIVLAENEDMEDVKQAMRIGVSDYLIKPLDDLEILELAIENSLNRKKLIDQNTVYRRNLEEINQELEERVEIFQMDQQAGKHVQKSMLPIPPQEINGFHFDHRVIPSLYLSGDSVDYKPLPRNQVLFYIADVSGHGSSSAFVTILLRFRIAQIHRHFILNRSAEKFSPADLLATLNKDLIDTGLDKHITVCVGVIDDNSESENNTGKASLLYSIAGHHPLPIVYENGKADLIPLEKNSFPVGLVEDAEYHNNEISLEKGFALFLFSDGILEYLEMTSMKEKEEHLINTITDCEGDFRKVKSKLNLHRDIKIPDDIAVLSVKGNEKR